MALHLNDFFKYRVLGAACIWTFKHQNKKYNNRHYSDSYWLIWVFSSSEKT